MACVDEPCVIDLGGGETMPAPARVAPAGPARIPVPAGAEVVLLPGSALHREGLAWTAERAMRDRAVTESHDGFRGTWGKRRPRSWRRMWHSSRAEMIRAIRAAQAAGVPGEGGAR